ncbi:MAG: DUF5665 domain-containing protein [Candidatus Woykebacteria bacterium]
MDKEKVENEAIEVEVGKGYTKVHLSTGKIMINNFLGGLAWGFGTVLGATIIAALVLFVLSKLNTVPIIGGLINKIQ